MYIHEMTRKRKQKKRCGCGAPWVFFNFSIYILLFSVKIFGDPELPGFVLKSRD